MVMAEPHMRVECSLTLMFVLLIINSPTSYAQDSDGSSVATIVAGTLTFLQCVSVPLRSTSSQLSVPLLGMRDLIEVLETKVCLCFLVDDRH